MKMTKTLGLLAGAVALWAVGFVSVAEAAGDIRSIDAVATDSHTEVYGPDNIVRVGQKISFEIRLLNANVVSTRLEGVACPWMLKALPGWEATAAAFPLQIGLWMGGHRAWATLESMDTLENVYANGLTHSSYDDLIPVSDRAYYTRMIFTYEVEPGDIAMPVRFSNAAGTGEIQKGQSYSFNNTTYWSVVDYLTGTTCSFVFGENPITDPMDQPPGWQSSSPETYEHFGNWDLSLSGTSASGFFVQTVDFDTDENPWRTFPANSANAEEGAPAVVVPGKASDDVTTTVYLWTEDSKVVTMANGKNEKVYRAKSPVTGEMTDYTVYTLSIVNATSATFKMKAAADAEGKSTYVYLSSSPTNIWTSSGSLITNFTSRVVKVVEPELPHITLSLDTSSITCDGAYDTIKAQLTVEASMLPTNTCRVCIKPTIGTVGGPALEAGVIGFTTDAENVTGFDGTNLVFTTSTEKRTVYIYGLGFATNDLFSSTSQTICFTPYVTDDGGYYSGTMASVNLKVKEAKPVITDYPSTVTTVAAADCPVTIKVSDSYANLSAKYKVEWKPTPADSWKTLDKAYTADDDGAITVTLKYDGEVDGQATAVRVTGADGQTSESVTFTATVAGAQTAILVTEREDSTNYHKYAEGEYLRNAYVQLKNWKNETGAPVYAFLTPTNFYKKSSRADLLGTADCFTTADDPVGLKIASGETVSEKFTVKVLDDNSAGKIEFAIEIRTHAAYNDPAGRSLVTVGEDAAANYISVENVAPAFKTLGINGGVQAIVGGKATGKTVTAELGVTKTFAWSATDVSADLTGMKTVWNMTTPTGATPVGFPKTIEGNPSSQTFQYKFTQKGSWQVTVQMYDKDMDDQDEESWTSYTFDVVVGNAPALGFVFPDETSANYHYTEDCTDAGDFSYFRVGPLTAQADDIEIKVKAAMLAGVTGTFDLFGADDEGYVTLTIPAGVSLDTDTDGAYTRVDLLKLDGTATTSKASGGIQLSAAVTTETLSPDGIPYAELFAEKKVKTYVNNTAPVLEISSEPAPSGTNASVTVSANQTITLEWEITDVEADLATGLELKFSGLPADAKYSEGVDNTSPEGSVSFAFSGSGSHTVTVYAKDKDKGISASFKFVYTIESSKDAYVIPLGPVTSGQSDLSSIYAGADGLGAGRVFSEGSGNFTKASDFWHYYSFAIAETAPTFFATGYSVGQVDDGTLSSRDNAISQSGDNPNDGKTIANPYDYATYSEDKDSFFYAWIVNANSDEESGAMTGTAYISPVSGTNQTVKKTFSLPNEDINGDNDSENTVPSYEKLVLEAVFSLEYFTEDNMGDINQDGVPDFYAYKWNLYTLMSGDSDSDSSDATGLTTGIDVKKNVAAYNGDEPGDGSSSESEGDSTGDFLPMCYDHVGCSWLPGTAFTARMEIRGFHEGLNEAGVSDVSLSEVERMALENAFAAAKDLGKDHGCATAEAWMLARYWSPETQRAATFGNKLTLKRCDPTSQDTDADNLPDGYEYYLWYMAKIGQLDETTGAWTRYTGSRFNPKTPGRGDVIPAYAVEAAFNPVEARGAATDRSAKAISPSGEIFLYNPTDFDEDGLPDFLEIAIGTNPASWDTDGDGISDYWEVLYGTDPCDDADGDRTADWQKSNPDRDFMAMAESADPYDIVTLSDGTAWAFKADAITADSYTEFFTPGETPMAAKATVNGTNYFFAATPKTYAVEDGFRLLYAAEGFGELKFGDTTFAVGARTFPAGTFLEAEPADASGDSVAPLALNAGLKALPLFLYGGREYVPAATNIKDNVETPVTAAAGATLAAFMPSTKITLIHDQVYREFGFDPRTAWTIDDYGYLGARWHKANSTEGNDSGSAGRATNTVAYTTRDEYLLSDYLCHVKGVELTTDSYTHLTVTTCPSQTYAVTNAIDEADNKTIYGADTDGDGIPDGWELYVGLDPNNAEDATLATLDGDELVPLAEFAGTDACNAYTNLYDTAGNLIYEEVSSIVEHHPGNTSGWFNKFFPTDPRDADTDGDGLDDDKEGASWKSAVPLGRGTTGVLVLNFIYGDSDELVDDGSCCIRGGGLNPCTVDTDQDLLPDAWEYQFAGYIVEKETSGVGTYIEGGMDGTWPNDAYTRLSDGTDENAESVLADPRTGTERDYDFDHDGLQNFQEYLVQSVRHFRYDDSETPLMGRLPGGAFVGFIPMQTFDGTAFFETCRKAGFNGSSAWKFRELGYFALPPKAWDRLRCCTKVATSLGSDGSGIASEAICNYADYEGTGWRIMLRPQGLSYESTAEEEKRVKASGYCCTDPRRWDTDNDGMDDYYELFHGLNPLFGGVTDPLSVQDANLNITDVIGAKYGTITACFNAWTGWPAMNPVIPDYDVMKYPWMIGDADCDADGDGLRNYDEALMVNITSPMPTHTDPTPLWMTDSTIVNLASFTAQYYGMDPYQGTPDLYNYPWAWGYLSNYGVDDGMMTLKNQYYMFAFEENEGYDTDHDGKSDSVELTKAVENASDPLLYSSPERRQALYFPGANAAAVSCAGTQQRNTSMAYDLLRQFTVECWVRPERVGGTEQVILERVCNYGPSTLTLNQNILRANFRLGINADGCVFGELEGNTANSAAIRITSAAVSETNVWAHYAITYDGSTFALYKDADSVPVAKAENVGVIPANGVSVILQEGNGEAKAIIDASGLKLGAYRTLPCALILGAGAKTAEALDVVAAAKDAGAAGWEAFDRFYAGYIDEVRVWDGARSATALAADYDHRYTFDEVKAQRNTVYQYWSKGYVRNDNISGGLMPPELLQHYNFVSLPGAVEPTDVALAPANFKEYVLDQVRVDGNAIDLSCGWWNALKTHSTVYRNYNLVPWIPNAVAHLPLMDGSVVDSQYWSENFAGTATFEADFPNTANPYPYYNFLGDKAWHYSRLCTTNANGAVYEAFANLYYFQLRSEFVGTSDLLPLGGAFAKRCADFWDGDGAMDVWSQTGTDTDGDGLPDWWEMMNALDIYDSADWNVQMSYEGRTMPAWEVYQRQLAKGLLPTGSYDGTYAAQADVDDNGLLDWWEDIYDFAGESTYDDHDNDQLSNYAEYLVGECFSQVNGVNRARTATDAFRALNPTEMMTYGESEGQLIPDYFLRVGSLYLGEMFTDHDFMEDWWESTQPISYVSHFIYDPLNDPDDDGWSTFAECRYGFWKSLFVAERTSVIVESDLDQICHPEPALAVRVSYHGRQNVEGYPLIARVSTDNPYVTDAQFFLPGYDEKVGKITGKDLLGRTQNLKGGIQSYRNDGLGCEQYVGSYRAEAILHGHLNPGNIVPGQIASGYDSVIFSRALLSTADTYIWGYDYYNEIYGTSMVDRSGSYQAYASELVRYPYITLRSSGLTWTSFTRVVPDSALHYGDIMFAQIAGSTNSVVVESTIGKIDYLTGEYTLDMAALASCVGTAEDINTWIIKVQYGTRLGATYPQDVYLSKPVTGYMREGRNILTMFIDLNNDGAWTAGEPFGCAEADLGWWKTPVALELTDTAPQMARYDLATALKSSGGAEGSGESGSSSGYTDRDVNGYVAANKTITYSISTEDVPSSVALRLRVARVTINGHVDGTNVAEVVLDRTFNADQRPFFTEADLLAEGLYDLDWGNLVDAARALGISPSAVSNVTYRVVIGNETFRPDITSDSFATEFVNVFETGSKATATNHKVGYGSPNGLVDAGSPTFSWRHDNGLKDYPAFQLRVWNAAGTLVYDSGVRRAPPRDSQGVYSWTAPIYAGMMTPEGYVFSAQENYTWAVAMLDAKYTQFNETAESKATFRLNATGETTLSDYGRIDVTVKYFGPAQVATNAVGKLLHVEAFTTPDFSGSPAGVGYVKDIASLASSSNLEVNATITGLAKDGTYYIRAFIDTDGDYVRDTWESWGYANYVGTDQTTVYTPKGFAVGAKNIRVYLEDTDIDNDGFPDAYEWEQKGNLDAIGPIANSGTKTQYAKVNPDLLSALSSYGKLDLAGASTVAPLVRMMSTAASDASSLNAASALLSGGAITEVETDARVTIVSFSLENGLVVSVDTTTDTGTDLVVIDDAATVDVTWKLLYKASLVDTQWQELASDTVSVSANATGTRLDTTAMNEAVKAQQQAAAGFFKVTVGVK